METNSYVPEIYIGENGNWFINGSDTGQPSRGPQGKSAYEIAVTFGYRGTEAEWLAGLKGEQGSKGDKGDKGDSGDRGIKGDKGDKGDSGDKGVKGDIGDTGDKGAKGDPGATGPQGIQGPKGDKGDSDVINDQTPTYAEACSLIQLSSGEKVSLAFGKIAKAVSTLISHVASKANESVMGHVKLSRSSSITETGAYALDAVEKNAGVSGTLAHQIAEQNTKLVSENIPIICPYFKDDSNSSRTKLIRDNKKMSLFVAGYNTMEVKDSRFTICTVPKGYEPNSLSVGILSTMDGKSTTIAIKENGEVYVDLYFNGGILPQYTWLFGEINWYLDM